MRPRTPTFHGSPDDVAHSAVADDVRASGDVLASQAVGRHTQRLRDWLAAPIHERGQHSTDIALAWQDVRSYGMTSEASHAATGIMRAHGKLRGTR